MKENINELIKKLPDYEDFMNLAEKIESFSKEKSMLEIKIKSRESEIVKTVTTDPAYFQMGKAPSMAYIDAAYKYAGLSNELIPMRELLADRTVQVDKLKLTMDIYRTMLDIWRTLSANERKASL